MESYEKAEKRFYDNLRIKEANFEEEKKVWANKLLEAQ